MDTTNNDMWLIEHWQARAIKAEAKLAAQATQAVSEPVATQPANAVQAELERSRQQFVDVSVALMKYVPQSEEAAKAFLQKLGDAHGYGWCQSELGKLWEAKHNCAPRGSMGVTVNDFPPSDLARDFPPVGGLTECDMGDSYE